MSNRDEENVDTVQRELARLRDALGAMHAPAGGEERLRAAFRARHGALELDTLEPHETASRPAAAAARSLRPRNLRLARARDPRRFWTLTAFGALAASAAAIVLVSFARFDDGTAPAIAESTDDAPVEALGGRDVPAVAFQPLLYAPSLAPSQSYNVVRVRIPLASLGYGFDAPPDGTIEADVLIGEDGLARGIRFDTTDTLVVSAVSH